MSYQPTQQGQQQSETETVSGQVAGVITKAVDKWQIAVNTGGQYARNLWTKDAGLVNQMQLAIGQYFDFVCGVSHWTGQNGPVRSLWINAVTAPGQAQQQPAQQPQYQQPVQQQAPPQQHQAPPMRVSDEERESRIMRQHAMGVAAQMLPVMAPEERNFQGMVTVAEGLLRYYRQGPPSNGNPPEPQSMRAPSAPGYGDDPGGYENTPPPHGDDDVPWPTQ